ncbi:hypothetical protein [Bacillus mycoides]|uniref:hypothetical protein n=1 Tax=Bacillus mycoides TaxID=1405 RepID=UPI00273A80CD|nr:hypothetical protein [Bacillus mycoides]
MNYKYADGNTGYYINEPGVGWKYAHGNGGGHQLNDPGTGRKYAYGNTGHHFEPGGGGH